MAEMMETSFPMTPHEIPNLNSAFVYSSHIGIGVGILGPRRTDSLSITDNAR